MTNLLMDVPVKACHTCWSSYTIPEWSTLELVDRDADEQIEYRLCSCGQPLALQLAGLDELELRVPVLAYQHEFPESGRPGLALRRLQALELKRSPARRCFIAGLFLLLLCVVALACYGAAAILTGAP